MPKSSKKKKEKAVDFSKAKLKLGKSKQLPSNAVDTSFKARSIALPTQSIAVEKDATLPTTRRKQSFDDLVSLMKHYNANTRKDAILSFRELFELHPGIVESSMTILLGSCVRLIGDEDAGVRKTLLSFFSWLLPLVSKEDLIPHVPLLILFTTSAQTHIFPEIRIDAVRFLDLFLELVPENVVDNWIQGNPGHGKRVLEGYLGILNAGTKYGDTEGEVKATSTASVVLSSQSKLVVLKSLSAFLTHAVSRQLRPSNHTTSNLDQAAVPLPTWFLSPSFRSARSFNAYERLFRSESVDCQPQLDAKHSYNDFICIPDFATGPLATAWSLDDLSGLSLAQTESLTHPNSNTCSLIHLARTLYSTLLASYLDCAPIVFSPSANPPEAELNLLTVTARIMRTLYGSILQDRFSLSLGEEETLCDEISTLLGYMTGYFPFRPARREIKVEHAFQDLNVIYCELTALLVLVSFRRPSGDILYKARFPSSRSHASTSHIKHEGKLALQASLVRTYVTRLLLGEDDSGAQISRPLIPTMYIALLPTIWALLNQPKESHTWSEGEAPTDTVLSAMLDHAIRTTSNSSVKALTVEFVARILLLETETDYCGYFDVRNTGEQEKFQKWILHLPRTLWEIGPHNLAASETVIKSLLRLLQRGSIMIKHEEIIGLQTRLIPFFMITHPVRGRLPGPFTKIPTSSLLIRRLAVDLVVTILSVSPRSEGEDRENLMIAVGSAVSGTLEEGYWQQLVRATGLS
jgi:pre-rRNA-processing protein IPI1